ncbi:hypothetical protein SAMN05444162_0938 [Paenibacillaceae bacterium GAS479]|nr:hypothetical protein SAMN05444162_0938 [Paenibacillaceae bacterium GAS479]
MNLILTRRPSGKKRNSFAPASLTLMAMLMLAAGCGANPNDTANAQNVNGGGIVDSSSGVSPDSAGKPVAQATPIPDKPATSTSKPATQSQKQQGTGIFNGLADGHSAEIKTDTDTIVFQASTEQIERMNKFEFGDPVSFSYIVKVINSETEGKIKQPWIVEIKKES